MERVAFLLERTGERLGCLLNPESVVMVRSAGVLPRRAVGGPLAGADLADEPLIYTGGGRTELTLDLLFDVDVAGSSIVARDVRDLTRPLWQLAENTAERDEQRQPPLPLVRLIWGKSWNVPGVVDAVAERLERFDSEGAPRRSWLRLRMLRVVEPAASGRQAASSLPPAELPPEAATVPEEQVGHHDLRGGPVSEGDAHNERLDEVAAQHYGEPAYWKLLAAFNGISNPLALPAGQRLRMPPLSLLQGR